jgi:hypothetical protein
MGPGGNSAGEWLGNERNRRKGNRGLRNGVQSGQGCKGSGGITKRTGLPIRLCGGFVRGRETLQDLEDKGKLHNVLHG